MASNYYKQLLGLNTTQEPPAPHELLGLPSDCHDRLKINQAARLQIKKLDRYALSQDHDLVDASQRLMNEVAQARNALLSALPDDEPPSDAATDSHAPKAASIDNAALPSAKAKSQPVTDTPQSTPATTTQARAPLPPVIIQSLIWGGVGVAVLMLATVVISLTLYLGMKPPADQDLLTDQRPTESQGTEKQATTNNNADTQTTAENTHTNQVPASDSEVVSKAWAEVYLLITNASPSDGLVHLNQFLAIHPEHSAAQALHQSLSTQLRVTELKQLVADRSPDQSPDVVKALGELIQLSAAEDQDIALWHELRMEIPESPAEQQQRALHAELIDLMFQDQKITEAEFIHAKSILSEDPRVLNASQQAMALLIWDLAEARISVNGYRLSMDHLSAKAIKPKQQDQPTQSKPAKLPDWIVRFSDDQLVIKFKPDLITTHNGQLILTRNKQLFRINLIDQGISTKNLMPPSEGYDHLAFTPKKKQVWWQSQKSTTQQRLPVYLYTSGRTVHFRTDPDYAVSSRGYDLFTINKDVYKRYMLDEFEFRKNQGSIELQGRGIPTKIFAASQSHVARLFMDPPGYSVLLVDPTKRAHHLTKLPDGRITSRHKILKMGLLKMKGNHHEIILKVQKPDSSISVYTYNTQHDRLIEIGHFSQFQSHDSLGYLALIDKNELLLLHQNTLSPRTSHRLMMPEGLTIDRPIHFIELPYQEDTNTAPESRLVIASNQPDAKGHYHIQFPLIHSSEEYVRYAAGHQAPKEINRGSSVPLKPQGKPATVVMKPNTTTPSLPKPQVIKKDFSIPSELQRYVIEASRHRLTLRSKPSFISNNSRDGLFLFGRSLSNGDRLLQFDHSTGQVRDLARFFGFNNTNRRYVDRQTRQMVMWQEHDLPPQRPYTIFNKNYTHTSFERTKVDFAMLDPGHDRMAYYLNGEYHLAPLSNIQKKSATIRPNLPSGTAGPMAVSSKYIAQVFTGSRTRAVLLLLEPQTNFVRHLRLFYSEMQNYPNVVQLGLLTKDEKIEYYLITVADQSFEKARTLIMSATGRSIKALHDFPNFGDSFKSGLTTNPKARFTTTAQGYVIFTDGDDLVVYHRDTLIERTSLRLKDAAKDLQGLPIQVYSPQAPTPQIGGKDYLITGRDSQGPNNHYDIQLRELNIPTENTVRVTQAPAQPDKNQPKEKENTQKDNQSADAANIPEALKPLVVKVEDQRIHLRSSISALSTDNEGGLYFIANDKIIRYSMNDDKFTQLDDDAQNSSYLRLMVNSKKLVIQSIENNRFGRSSNYLFALNDTRSTQLYENVNKSISPTGDHVLLQQNDTWVMKDLTRNGRSVLKPYKERNVVNMDVPKIFNHLGITHCSYTHPEYTFMLINFARGKRQMIRFPQQMSHQTRFTQYDLFGSSRKQYLVYQPSTTRIVNGIRNPTYLMTLDKMTFHLYQHDVPYTLIGKGSAIAFIEDDQVAIYRGTAPTKKREYQMENKLDIAKVELTKDWVFLASEVTNIDGHFIIEWKKP